MAQVFEFNALYNERLSIEKEVYDWISKSKPEVAKELSNKIQEICSNEKLKIAFVGQHNSGKSTIISALTGRRDIAISTDVETDVPTPYPWQGVRIVDTPGLHAGVKESHDKDSLDEIKKSDLLVYCITSSLFDDLNAQDFCELAYQKLYKSKMILLVNKMFAEYCGDVDFNDQVSTYRDDLDTQLKNFSGDIDDFLLSFVEAEDYIKGVDLCKESKVRNSHFEDFIYLLNSFINEKKLIARLDTPCRIINDTIESEILSTGTKVDKDMMDLLSSCESSLLQFQDQAQKQIDNTIIRIESRVAGEANILAAMVGQVDISKDACKDVNNRICRIVKEESKRLNQELSTTQNNSNEEMKRILDSNLEAGEFDAMNNNWTKINPIVLSSVVNFASAYGVTKVLGNVSNGISKMASNGTKLVGAAGSDLHKLVKTIGHFFGKSFKPWEAVKIVSKMGKVAKALGPILSAITILIDIVDAAQEEQRKKEIIIAKGKVYHDYAEIAHEISDNFVKEGNAFNDDVFGSQIQHIRDIKRQMIDDKQMNSEYVTKLKELHSKVNNYIKKIATI